MERRRIRGRSKADGRGCIPKRIGEPMESGWWKMGTGERKRRVDGSLALT